MTEKTMSIARLNARLQRLDRGSPYEEPLDDALRRSKLGAVTGGGTLRDATGEIELCDIEVELERRYRRLRELVSTLREGAWSSSPKSS
jgi:hypothetical protein